MQVHALHHYSEDELFRWDLLPLRLACYFDCRAGVAEWQTLRT